MNDNLKDDKSIDENNSRRTKIVLGVILVASLVVLVGSLTYAYFISEGVKRNQTVDIETGTMEITFSDGDEGMNAELNFGESALKKFAIKNTGTLDVPINIYWENLVNTYLEGSLTYTLSYSEVQSGTYTDIVTNENVPRVSSPSKRMLASNITIPVGKTYYYNLKVSLNYLDDVNQDDDMNASFSSTFKATDVREVMKHTLSFNAGDDITIEDVSVTEGEPYGILPEPTVAYGYSFGGWYTSLAYDKQITPETIVDFSENQTLYAKIEPKTVNVTLDVDGYFPGNFSDGSSKKVIQLKYGEEYGELPVADNIGECHTSSTGWYVEGTSEIAIKPTDKVTKAEDHTLYPIYRSCFTAGTLVYTPNGYVSIENLKVGDLVYSYNETTKEIEVSSIRETFIHQVREYLEVTLETGKTIKVTKEHPFYNPETDKWQIIGEFKVGDSVMDDNGNKVKIATIKNTGEDTIVYNLEVDGNHNYFVTKDNILVHNKTC